jgi:Holliday junction resolvase
MRKHGRIDGNHVEIVKALRQIGCSVLSLASIGNGAPDLLVARCGKMWLMEIKDGDKPPSQRRLTDDEIQFHKTWNAPVHIIESVSQALAIAAS